MEKLDLMSAKVKAADLSKKNSKKVYILVDEEGDCSLSYNPLPGTEYAYSNGSEIDVKEVEIEKPKKMEKVKKEVTKAAVKKEVKKGVPKKVDGTGKATTLVLTATQWKKFEAAIKDSNIREAVREAIIAKYKL